MLKRILLSAVAILLVAPAGLLGQSNIKVELVAEGGVFLPVRSFSSSDVVVPMVGTFNVKAKQQPGAAAAGRVILWFGEAGKFGFEATGQYSWSDLQTTITATPDTTESAAVWNATGRFVANFPIPNSKASIFVNVGAGAVGHTGDAYEDVEGTTDIAGVFGTGGRIMVAEKVGIRLDLDAVVYKFQPTLVEDGTSVELDSSTLADLSFLLGISILLGG